MTEEQLAKVLKDVLDEHTSAHAPLQCLTEDDRHDVRTLLQMYRDGSSVIRKTVLSLIAVGVLAFMALGLWHYIPSK